MLGKSFVNLLILALTPEGPIASHVVKVQHITSNQVNIRIADAQKQDFGVGIMTMKGFKPTGMQEASRVRKAGIEDTQGRGELRTTVEAREEQEAS